MLTSHPWREEENLNRVNGKPLPVVRVSMFGNAMRKALRALGWRQSHERILIVDDEENIRFLYKEELEDEDLLWNWLRAEKRPSKSSPLSADLSPRHQMPG